MITIFISFSISFTTPTLSRIKKCFIRLESYSIDRLSQKYENCSKVVPLIYERTLSEFFDKSTMILSLQLSFSESSDAFTVAIRQKGWIRF